MRLSFSNNKAIVHMGGGLVMGIYMINNKLIDAPFEELTRHDGSVRYCRTKTTHPEWQSRRLYKFKSEIFDLAKGGETEWEPRASDTVKGEAAPAPQPVVEEKMEPEDLLLSL